MENHDLRHWFPAARFGSFALMLQSSPYDPLLMPSNDPFVTQKYYYFR
jgi:hypothetical protein